MKKKLLILAVLMAVLCLVGCKGENMGKDLPEGMNKADVAEQGREVVAMIVDEDWQGLYDRLRDDAKETTSVSGIKLYMQELIGKTGTYVSEKDCMVTGQKMKDTGEKYATAVFFCKHEKKDVIYRIAFSTDMELMGFQAKKQ